MTEITSYSIYCTYLGPKRIVCRDVFILIQTEDSLFEDKLRLRGSHLRSVVLLTGRIHPGSVDVQVHVVGDYNLLDRP